MLRTKTSTTELAPYYSEKLAYLPASFYVNSYRIDAAVLPFVGRGSWSDLTHIHTLYIL